MKGQHIEVVGLQREGGSAARDNPAPAGCEDERRTTGDRTGVPKGTAPPRLVGVLLFVFELGMGFFAAHARPLLASSAQRLLSGGP